MFSKSENYKKVNCLRFSYRVFIQKKKFVNIHVPVIQFQFTQYVQYTAIRILPYTIH